MHTLKPLTILMGALAFAGLSISASIPEERSVLFGDGSGVGQSLQPAIIECQVHSEDDKHVCQTPVSVSWPRGPTNIPMSTSATTSTTACPAMSSRPSHGSADDSAAEIRRKCSILHPLPISPPPPPFLPSSLYFIPRGIQALTPSLCSNAKFAKSIILPSGPRLRYWHCELFEQTDFQTSGVKGYYILRETRLELGLWFPIGSFVCWLD
ncbi:hypothetical protein BCR34DRAFT_615327 [Clohesyomyces aquaticus]|uniref:Ig-like domain-containing protein n=1 Tax=Clohesyomyces aquaticus TaxID=1231657 RepID=A0A1Y1ZJB3_9PLEO|nr:hypothetical protein BCR34DRAFT_615327 [Clohesyomyces aquaticus]